MSSRHIRKARGLKAYLLRFCELTSDFLGVTQGKQSRIIRRHSLLRTTVLHFVILGVPFLLILKPRLRLLHLQQNIDKLRIPNRDGLPFPHQRLQLLPPLHLLRRICLYPQLFHQHTTPLHGALPVLRCQLFHNPIHIVRLLPPHLVRTMTDLGSDLVREQDRERLIAARPRRTRQLVQKASRDAQLDQRVLKVITVAQEAALEDEGVDGRFEEVFG